MLYAGFAETFVSSSVKGLRMTFEFCIGNGFDVHRLVPGRKLILGGVEIDFEKGLEGHSDADVLTHAIIDAVLGAAGLGDIGMWFPDSDEAHRDADSIELLRTVHAEIQKKGFVVGNIDAIVIAQKPKLGSCFPEMKERLSKALGCEVDRVNLKATTTEGMGFTGRGEGIAATAVALLACR